jgi:hypothetical protein
MLGIRHVSAHVLPGLADGLVLLLRIGLALCRAVLALVAPRARFKTLLVSAHLARILLAETPVAVELQSVFWKARLE